MESVLAKALEPVALFNNCSLREIHLQPKRYASEPLMGHEHSRDNRSRRSRGTSEHRIQTEKDYSSF